MRHPTSTLHSAPCFIAVVGIALLAVLVVVGLFVGLGMLLFAAVRRKGLRIRGDRRPVGALPVVPRGVQQLCRRHPGAVK